jgi:hypothetical protein
MTRDKSDDSLREASWRRPLTTAETDELHKQLAGKPDAKADWEAELALTEALRSLPNIPLASNFTARVVDAALRDSAAGQRKWHWLRLAHWPLRRLLPRLAFGLAVAAVGFFSFHQLHEAENERIGRSARVLSEVASVPGLDALSDFEAIRVMDAAPAADEELLRLMQ